MNTAFRQSPLIRFLRKLVGNLFCFVVPGAVLLLVVVFTVSPRAFTSFVLRADAPVRADATLHACELVRDGIKHAHAVRCEARYVYQGTSYQTAVDVWSSQSPFATPDSLYRQLARQRSRPSRDIMFSARDPQHATRIDERLFATPGLWAFWIVLLCALVGTALYRAPGRRIHRGDDYVLDKKTDELVPNRAQSIRRVHGQPILWTAALVVAMLACACALSTRFSNEIALLAFSKLEPHPAQLSGCVHTRYGGHKGHQQIDCGLRYLIDGSPLTGQAESLDFRFFPTRRRLDDRVAQREGVAVVAWVDPTHPTYAWAMIDDGWVVSHTIGVFELMLLLVLVGVLPVVLVVILRKRMVRAARHP